MELIALEPMKISSKTLFNTLANASGSCESVNFRRSYYLAWLHRKTLCYSKFRSMLETSLKSLFDKLNNH